MFQAPAQGILAGASTAVTQGLPIAAQAPAVVTTSATQAPSVGAPATTMPGPAGGPAQTNPPELVEGPDGSFGWIAPSASDPNWTPPDVNMGHFSYAFAVTARRNNDNSGSSEEE